MWRSGEAAAVAELKGEARKIEIQRRQSEKRLAKLAEDIKLQANRDPNLCLKLAQQYVTVQRTISRCQDTEANLASNMAQIEQAQLIQVQAKATEVSTRALERVSRRLNPAKVEKQLQKAGEAQDRMDDVVEQMKDATQLDDTGQRDAREVCAALTALVGVQAAERLTSPPTTALQFGRALPEAPDRDPIAVLLGAAGPRYDGGEDE